MYSSCYISSKLNSLLFSLILCQTNTSALLIMLSLHESRDLGLRGNWSAVKLFPLLPTLYLPYINFNIQHANNIRQLTINIPTALHRQSANNILYSSSIVSPITNSQSASRGTKLTRSHRSFSHMTGLTFNALNMLRRR